MKQNPTIPAILERACMALQNITLNLENQIIAVAAGAVQVHVTASLYPITLPMVLHLSPMVLYPLSPFGTPPLSLWYLTPLYGAPLLFMVIHLPLL